MQNTELYEKIVSAIKECYDPEIPVNIYDLGLIYKIEIDDDSKVEIDMTLTSPNCPSIEELPAEVENKVKHVAGVKEVILNLVWEPAFSQEMMSEEAQLALGIL